MHNLARGNARPDAARRGILVHDRIGTDLCTIADLDAADELAAREQCHVIADMRLPAVLHIAVVTAAQRHLLEDFAVFADDHGLPEDNAVGMRERNAAADLRVLADKNAVAADAKKSTATVAK